MLSLFVLATVAQARWKAPYSVLDKPVDVQEYASKYAQDGQNVSVKGDLLTIFFKSSEKTLQSFNSLNIPVKRVGDSDMWIGQARMENWDKVFFNYSVRTESETRSQMKVYYGPKAPKPFEAVPNLQGSVKTYKVPFTSVKEERDVTVYLPPGSPKNIPVVYMADGGVAAAYAPVVESLILRKKIRPIAMVGVANGAYHGDPANYEPDKDYRALEYLKVTGSGRYRLHLDFFCDVVTKWAETEFGVSANPKDRAIHGFSNGGAFAVTATADRPEVFGSAMPYSVAAFDRDMLKLESARKRLPNYYICAGRLETFIRGSEDSREILRANGASVRWKAFDSGHDSTMWSMAFCQDLQLIFPYRR